MSEFCKQLKINEKEARDWTIFLKMDPFEYTFEIILGKQ